MLITERNTQRRQGWIEGCRVFNNTVQCIVNRNKYIDECQPNHHYFSSVKIKYVFTMTADEFMLMN